MHYLDPRSRMSSVFADLTIDSGARQPSVPPGVPPTVVAYAQAFLKTARDSLRFLWRDDERWLAVHLIRKSYGTESNRSSSFRNSTSVPDRVSLRVAEIDLPRGITVREVDVLTLLALGLTNVGIAERLGTSARTVSTQIERLLTKLDQNTRGGLSALAVDSGLLRLPIPGGVIGGQESESSN